jgi:CRISPR/Cas system type I-B associated protein Csh2 (Cas7 group RAMP superfamily)
MGECVLKGEEDDGSSGMHDSERGVCKVVMVEHSEEAFSG